MGAERPGLRRAEPDDGPDRDKRRARIALRRVERRIEGVDVVAVVGRHFLRVPAVRGITRANVFCE